MTITRGWVERWRAAPERVVLVDAAHGSVWDGARIETRSAVFAGAPRTRAACGPATAWCSRARRRSRRSRRTSRILRLGAVVVPANTGYTRGELEHIVGDVRPVLAVVDDRRRADAGAPGGAALARAHARHPPSASMPPTPCGTGSTASADDALAMVAYTSGTTGRPKGAMLTRGNLRAGAEALVEAWEWTPDDRLVHALPMFHMHGLGAAINGSAHRRRVDGGAPALRPAGGGRRGGATTRRCSSAYPRCTRGCATPGTCPARRTCACSCAGRRRWIRCCSRRYAASPARRPSSATA